MRDGVSAEESVAVWNLYKKLFDGPVEVRISSTSSPVGEVYDVVKNNLDTDFIVAFGKGEESRYTNMANQPNVTVFDGGTIEGADATNLRMALASNNTEEIAKYLPDGVTVDEFLTAINEKPVEEPATEPTTEPVAEPTATPTPETPLQESPPIDDMNDDYYDYGFDDNYCDDYCDDDDGDDDYCHYYCGDGGGDDDDLFEDDSDGDNGGDGGDGGRDDYYDYDFAEIGRAHV